MPIFGALGVLPQPVCGHCGAAESKAGALLFCSQCHAVRYCDVECQKRDWRYGGHRESCNRVVAGNVSKQPQQQRQNGDVQAMEVESDESKDSSVSAEDDSDSRSSFSSSFSNASYSSSTSSPTSSVSFETTTPSSPTFSPDARSGRSPSTQIFSLEELRFALYHMPDNSKMGPDGFPVLFYKTFFDHMGPPLLKVLEETLARIGGDQKRGRKDDWMNSGLATRQLKSIPRERKRLVSLRGSIQRALRLDHNGNDKSDQKDSSSLETPPPPPPPTPVSDCVFSRPAIERQLRAMSEHPDVDYVIFTSAASTTTSSLSRKNGVLDTGVVILNSDARLLFRVNWNHAVFATRSDAVAPHARLLFEQLRGPPPRLDVALDRALAAQLKREFGCEIPLVVEAHDLSQTNSDIPTADDRRPASARR